MIRPFECEVTGTAEGRARVKASIHTILSTFDEEEWSIVTLMVDHPDSQLKYTDLFAPSCGSIGDFTDIKKFEEGYVVPTKMRNFNFPVRKFDGTFYVQVGSWPGGAWVPWRALPSFLWCCCCLR